MGEGLISIEEWGWIPENVSPRLISTGIKKNFFCKILFQWYLTFHRDYNSYIVSARINSGVIHDLLAYFMSKIEMF